MGWGARIFALAAACALAAGAHAAVAQLVAPERGSAGPALRAARLAAERGAHEDAARRFREAATRFGEIADHAALFEARVWLAAERPADALEAARLGLRAAPESPLAAALERVAGDAADALGDGAGARLAWERALAARPPAAERAALRLAIARSLEREGRRDAAAQRYLELWVEHPAAPEAAEAEARLGVLERELGRSLRTARVWRRRADGLFRRQHTLAALEAYEAVLASKPGRADRRRAEQQRAHCLFRLRRYPEAADAFAALGTDPEAKLWHARALARSGRVPESIRELEALGRSRAGRNGVWARLLAGLLHEGRGRGERARELYASVASGDDSYARAALWRLGWAAYRDGRYDEAREHFLALAERDEHPIDRLRPRYWAARTLEHVMPEGARAEIAALARDYPFSYYGWRAAQHLGSAAPPPGAERALPRGRDQIAPHDLVRPRVLLEAGYGEEAIAECDRLRHRARGLAERLELARLYADAGDFHGAERMLVDAYAEPLARGPAPGFEEAWWLAWPDAYMELVEASVPPPAAVTPEVVLAVMREESGYRPDAVSVTGALGLLQIMPDTGSRLARDLGIPAFRAPDLLLPPVNIRLGGFYLDRLARRFDGRLDAAIASYNAGPTAVAGWLGEAELADDEWVEAIPYSQTRAYVKRVLRSVYVYRVLY